MRSWVSSWATPLNSTATAPEKDREGAPTGAAGRAGARGRLVPALPAARRLAQEGRPREEGRLLGRVLLGPPRPRLRRPGSKGRHPRPRPRRPRRQPDRSPLHRRPLGRLSLRRAPPHGFREPARLAPPRRRPPALWRLDLRRRPLRPAAEQTYLHRARHLPPLRRPRARAARRQGRGLPRRLRLGRGAAHL
jgi:hypothetical protein